MRIFIWTVFLALFMAACQKQKTSDASSVIPVDSMVDSTVVDSAVIDTMPAPPKSADGLFDDFIYSFMRSRRFQTERIVFPLSVMTDGKQKYVRREDWKYDPLYARQDVYMVIYDSKRAMKAEKDTGLTRVTVEKLHLSKHRVKQYHFCKQRGLWMLTGIDEHDFSKDVNADFYHFYSRFSTDADFQAKHVDNPFHFKTYDSDNFQPIEGSLDAYQWPDYAPVLPSGVVTNINYGQSYGNINSRIVLVCSQSGGMGCTLSFVRRGRTWMLTALDN